MKAVAARWGTSTETVRQWIRQSEVDAGRAPEEPTASGREIRELKRRCAEWERTIEALRAARSFFAAPAWGRWSVLMCGPADFWLVGCGLRGGDQAVLDGSVRGGGLPRTPTSRTWPGHRRNASWGTCRLPSPTSPRSRPPTWSEDTSPPNVPTSGEVSTSPTCQ